MEKGSTTTVAMIALVTALILGFLAITLKRQSRVQQTDIRYQSAFTENGTIRLTLRNTGERTVNTSRLELTAWRNLEKENLSGTNCFQSSGAVKTGESYTCDTRLKMPEPGQNIEFVVHLEDSGKKWKHSCEPRTSSSISC